MLYRAKLFIVVELLHRYIDIVNIIVMLLSYTNRFIQQLDTFIKIRFKK